MTKEGIMDNGFSPADMAAVMGNENGGFGGWTGLIALLIIASIFTGGGGWLGNRGTDFGQYATAASQTEILLGQQFQNLDNKIDRIGNGIADAAFALNNSIGAVGSQVLDAKYDNALRIDNLGARMQECCCETQRAIDGVNYNTAMQTQKVLDAINGNRMADMQSQINQLQLQAAMCGVPRISTYAYGIVPQFACGYYGGTQF